jgi:hypothetical protein
MFDIATAMMNPFRKAIDKLTDEQIEARVWEEICGMGPALFTFHVICKRTELRHSIEDVERVVATLNRFESMGRIEHAEDIKSGDGSIKLYRLVDVIG